MSGQPRTRILDLFCGIGGVAEAVRQLRQQHADRPSPANASAERLPAREVEVTAAIDIDHRVGEIYSANHGVEVTCRTLESVQDFPAAELWWLSPPCQPYTRRGRGRAESDPRSAALANLIERIPQCLPERVALENVPEFIGSAHHRQLVRRLEESGYEVCTERWCPTQWGIPMRRRRAYLRARRDGHPLTTVVPTGPRQPLREFLDAAAEDDRSLRVDPAVVERYRRAMDVVDPADPQAVAACFTSAYATSPVRAGSYLRVPGESGSDRPPPLRRFSPREIGALLGFRPDFAWPENLSRRARYRLLGNALAVTVVAGILETLLSRPDGPAS